MQDWLEDHWNDRWGAHNKDRWNFKNQRLGWNEEDLKAEFDEFFSRNDANSINDGTSNQ